MSDIYLTCPDPDCQQNGSPWEHGHVIQKDPLTGEKSKVDVIFCPRCEIPVKWDAKARQVAQQQQ